jgi:hypothetical protein
LRPSGTMRRGRRPAGRPDGDDLLGINQPPFAWPRRAWLGPQPAWLRAPVPALGGSVPWAATAAAALREPAPVPEVADLALLSFFQVHRMRRAQVRRPRISLTHGSPSFGSLRSAVGTSCREGIGIVGGRSRRYAQEHRAQKKAPPELGARRGRRILGLSNEDRKTRASILR